MIQEHHLTFILDKNELGCIQSPPVNIGISDPTPVRKPAYHYPEKAKELIAEFLQDMEARDMIEPSTAAWLSPIVLVTKPDGSKHINYREMISHLTTDINPLPRLEELVETSSGNQYYATLDLKDAYFQVMLDEESRDVTTFSDGVSLYRFKRLPFGLNCSPAIFSCQMTTMLSTLIKQGWVRNYLDDVILFNALFVWTDKCQEAFQKLKQCFTQAPVLVKADISQPFVVTTDASKTHVGGVLSPVQPDGTNKAIAYFSKKMKPTEVRYSATDKGALTMVLTCKNFHHYLWGVKFTIFTDHQPLTNIFKKKTVPQNEPVDR